MAMVQWEVLPLRCRIYQFMVPVLYCNHRTIWQVWGRVQVWLLIKSLRPQGFHMSPCIQPMQHFHSTNGLTVSRQAFLFKIRFFGGFVRVDMVRDIWCFGLRSRANVPAKECPSWWTHIVIRVIAPYQQPSGLSMASSSEDCLRSNLKTVWVPDVVDISSCGSHFLSY